MNQGNTCYQNVIVQLLASIPEVHDLLSERNVKLALASQTTHKGAFAEIVHKLLRDLMSAQHKLPLKCVVLLVSV